MSSRHSCPGAGPATSQSSFPGRDPHSDVPGRFQRQELNTIGGLKQDPAPACGQHLAGPPAGLGSALSMKPRRPGLSNDSGVCAEASEGQTAGWGAMRGVTPAGVGRPA